jgi:hypothetical protein
LTAVVGLTSLVGCFGDGGSVEDHPGAGPRGEIFFYGLPWERRLIRIDVPGGEVTTRRVAAGAGDLPFRIVLTGEKIVYWGPRAAYAVDPALRTEPRRLGGGSYFVPSQRSGRVWLTVQDRSNERRPTLSSVREVSANGGSPGATNPLPPGRWTILFGSVGRFLLFDDGPRAVAVWDPSTHKVVEHLPAKTIAATNGKRVAWWPRQGRRQLVISRLKRGSLEVESRVHGIRLSVGTGKFSPDGSRLALPRGSELAMVTARTGRARLVEDAKVTDVPGIAWSENGEWVYFADSATGIIWAHQAGTKGAIMLEAHAPVRPAPGGQLAFVDMAAR